MSLIEILTMAAAIVALNLAIYFSSQFSSKSKGAFMLFTLCLGIALEYGRVAFSAILEDPSFGYGSWPSYLTRLFVLSSLVTISALVWLEMREDIGKMEKASEEDLSRHEEELRAEVPSKGEE